MIRQSYLLLQRRLLMKYLNKNQINLLIEEWKHEKRESEKDEIFMRICGNYIAKFVQIKPYNMELDDWLNECRLITFLAIQSYDISKGSGFHTHLTWKIKSVRLRIQNNNFMIKKPNKNKIDDGGRITESIDAWTHDRTTIISYDIEEQDIVRWVRRKFNQYQVDIILKLYEGWTLSAIAKSYECTSENIRLELKKIICRINGTVYPSYNGRNSNQKKQYQKKYRDKKENKEKMRLYQLEYNKND